MDIRYVTYLLTFRLSKTLADTLVVYTHTMKWPKNDGNKLDEDPMMTKFMVGVLVRFNICSSTQ